ncbi:hypothetical protein [Rubrobacter indicoceani]|uniref:hypothetical protein n=1 Tax=Rubrobacter indicoceani TaxID=2051957 RepID=UPI000E5B2008|nr:hypothetical protein [Rubrobacter indicoceani]
MSDIWFTFVCWFNYLINSIPFAIVAAINVVMSAVAALVNAAISLLPDSNVDVPQIGNDIIGMLNWLFPVGPLVAEAGLIITAWAFYKGYRYLFRWVV